MGLHGLRRDQEPNLMITHGFEFNQKSNLTSFLFLLHVYFLELG